MATPADLETPSSVSHPRIHHFSHMALLDFDLDELFEAATQQSPEGDFTLEASEELLKNELADFVREQLEDDKREAELVAKRVLRRRKRLRELENDELSALMYTNKKLRATCEEHGLHWVGLEVLQHECMLRAIRPKSPIHDMNPVDPTDAFLPV